MIRYTCCKCGGEFPATPADLDVARAQSPYADCDAFRDYGRDLCPRCTPREVTGADLIRGLRMLATARGNPV
jgi:hypothetical protein